jgi:predicted glutamine amidotransferase
MCGIVGIVSAFTNGFSMGESGALQDMIFVDTLRGWDSTGVFGVTYNGNVEIAKDALNGSEFICTKEYKDFASTMSRRGIFAVGHNRAATRGTIKDTNAHPFWVNDKIVLVQNGTHRGSHKHLKDVEVDTDALAHVLDEEEDIEKALQKVDAAFALVWYNVEKQKLHMIRNTERPLCLAYTKDGGIVFASEIDTIIWAASRNNLTLKSDPYLIKENHLVTLNLDTNKKTWNQDNKDVDVKYRHTGGSSYYVGGHSFRHNMQHYMGFGMGDDEIGTDYHSGNVRQLPSPSTSTADAVKTSFNTAICNSKYAEYLYKDMEGVEAGVAMLADAVGKDGTMFIELLDYIPANDHPKCKSWHVFGTLVDQRIPVNGPCPLIHWIICDKDEQDIVNFVAESFYTAKKTTIITTTTMVDEDKRYVLTAFAHACKPVQQCNTRMMAS